MNVNEVKLNHPKKGPMSIGRWSKNDLGIALINMSNELSKIRHDFYMYHLLYGFHDS